MRTALSLFVTALICVGIAWWISLLPGTVTATIAGTTLSSSTPIAVTLLLILFLLVYVLIRLLAWLISIPRRSRRWRSGRQRGRGEVALNRALIALAANDSGAARREAERGRRLLGDTPLTLLLAAQAGKQAGRDDEATALYEKLAERPDARLLGLRGLIRIAIDKQDWQVATSLAADAERAHPGAKWLREERSFMAQQTGEWREALRLAAPESKAALAVAASTTEDDPRAAMGLAKQAFDMEPGLAPAAIAYAGWLRHFGRAKQAQEVLRQSWSAQPHPDTAAAFVEQVHEPVARARELAVLVRANPDNAEACLIVAQAALDAGMVADARHQLERARQAGVNDRRFWTLLADVHVMEGDNDGAQEALRQVAEADANPTWVCEKCGTQYDHWHAVCDTCRSTGSIHWTRPTGSSPTRYRLQAPQGIEGLTA